MKIGTPAFWTGPGATVDNTRRFAIEADRLGFDYMVIGEHLFYPKGPITGYPLSADGTLPIDPSEPNLEIFTTFAYIAALTERIRLQTNIVVAPYRSPIVVAKMVATLDNLSKGRFELGLGTGWMREEFEALGLEFAERGRMTDECLEAMQVLLATGGPFRGKYVSFPEVWFEPRPERPVPIIMAGVGARTRERVARFAQGWVPVTLPEMLADELRQIRALMDRYGRGDDPLHVQGVIAIDTGGPNVPLPPLGSPDEVLSTLQMWADAGATAITVYMGQCHEADAQRSLDAAQRFAEDILPEARTIRSATA